MATIAASAPRAEGVRTKRRSVSPLQVVGKVLFWALVVFLFLYTLFPFYWAFVTALKPPAALGQFPVNYFPTQIDWSNFQYVFDNQGFLLSLRNSIIISVVTVTIALILGAFAAYAMGRMRFRGKNFSLYLILSMTMFPQIAILGSLFQTIRRLNLYNTMPALIITYLTFTLPFTVWVLANFFKAMPGELEEAALVDGATPFEAFLKILLPLALPGLVTTGLLAFIAAWNEFLFALTFTSTGDFRARTVQPAIASFSGRSQFEEPWGAVMAASVVVTVPLIVLVLIFQRKILAGLTAGAVKG
jgi:trehalose/maltose transport system permease protein